MVKQMGYLSDRVSCCFRVTDYHERALHSFWWDGSEDSFAFSSMTTDEKCEKLEILVKELFLLIEHNNNEPTIRRRRIDGYMAAKRLEFDALVKGEQDVHCDSE